MTLDEFLRWDDGTETHYELIGGFPLAMAPSLAAERILVTRLASAVEAALANRRPAHAQISAGIVPPDQAETFFVADIAAIDAAIEPRRQAIFDPFLVIEILSPSTERHDRRVKLPLYRQIDSVQEILFIDSDGMHAELHRRAGAQWITEILRGADAVLNLVSVPIEIRLGEGIALPDSED
jgi:Uma2 family endonuclease